MDRIINYVYNFVQELPNSTFIVIMGTLVALGFYFFSMFMKANKKDSGKISKISRLLTTLLLIVIIMVLTNIRY